MKDFANAVTTAGYAVAPTADLPAGQALIVAAGYSKDADPIYKKNAEALTATITVDMDIAKDIDGANRWRGN